MKWLNDGMKEGGGMKESSGMKEGGDGTKERWLHGALPSGEPPHALWSQPPPWPDFSTLQHDFSTVSAQKAHVDTNSEAAREDVASSSEAAATAHVGISGSSSEAAT